MKYKKQILCSVATLGLLGATGVYAVSFSSNTKVKVSVASFISMNVRGTESEGSAVMTEIMPGKMDQSMQNIITVYTNAVDGYVLTVSDKDENTNMVSEAGGIIPAGTNIAEGVSAWAIKGGALANWTAMVSSNATPLTLKTYNGVAGSGDVTNVTYGVSTTGSQQSGLYEDVIVYTATANDVIPEEDPITMQTFDSSSMLPNNGDTMTLEDERDGKMYTVARLADGNVWMTQNLRLDLDSTKALTTADTDITSNWTPVRSTIANGNLSADTWQNDYNTPYSYNGGSVTDGNYYNWSAAVAMNDTSSLTADGTNVTTSICPKGWTLPQNGTTGKTYANLGAAYGLPTTNGSSSTAYQTLEQNPLNFVRAGFVYGGSLRNQGSYGGYWSSTVVSSNYAYSVLYNTSIYGPQLYYYRNFGFSVRCVAR